MDEMHGGASVCTLRMRRRDGMLWINFEGTLSPSTAVTLRAALTSSYRRDTDLSAVVDMRNATVLMTETDWTAVAEDGQRSAKTLPIAIAFVVPRGTLTVAHRHCWRMAQQGMVRYAFTSLSDALNWAKEKSGRWEGSRV